MVRAQGTYLGAQVRARGVAQVHERRPQRSELHDHLYKELNTCVVPAVYHILLGGREGREGAPRAGSPPTPGRHNTI